LEMMWYGASGAASRIRFHAPAHPRFSGARRRPRRTRSRSGGRVGHVSREGLYVGHGRRWSGVQTPPETSKHSHHPINHHHHHSHPSDDFAPPPECSESVPDIVHGPRGPAPGQGGPPPSTRGSPSAGAQGSAPQAGAARSGSDPAPRGFLHSPTT